MHNNPLVSIVMPVYNEEPSILLLAINSVLDQTYENIELIIIDDGSNNDNVINTINNIQHNKKHIITTYKLPTNTGISNAFNTGVRKANGDIIGFLGSDDVYYPNKIKKQLQQWDHQYKWSFTGYSSISIIDNPTQNKYTMAFGDLLYYQYGFSNSSRPINQNIINAIPGLRKLSFNTILFHKNIINKIGLFDKGLMFAHDLDFIIKLCIQSDCWTISDELVICRDYPTANHRVKNNTSEMGNLDLTIICNKLYNYLNGNGYKLNHNFIVLPFYQIRYGCKITTDKAIVIVDINTHKIIDFYGNTNFINSQKNYIKNYITEDVIIKVIEFHSKYIESTQ